MNLISKSELFVQSISVFFRAGFYQIHRGSALSALQSSNPLSFSNPGKQRVSLGWSRVLADWFLTVQEAKSSGARSERELGRERGGANSTVRLKLFVFVVFLLAPSIYLKKHVHT